jgi:superfamily II DNA or RNA helicase
MPTPQNGSQKLYSWQQAALAAWESAGRRGMVEAVTGSGKTQVGIGALKKLAAAIKGLSCLVVVPSIVLMKQWYERLTAAFPGEKVGRIGGNYKDDFSILPIACVAVVNSAVLKVDQLLAHCKSAKNKSLLIADECHHYIDAPVFSRIRRFPFDYTLGLSATLFPFEVEGLGRIIYQYGFKEAYRDGIVPPFDLVNVAIPLTRIEREDYLELGDEITRQLQSVMNQFGQELDNVPAQRFFSKLRQLMNLPGGGEDPTIKRLFVLMFQRAKIVYTAEGKMRLAEQLTRTLVERGRKKLLVFFERIQSAEEAEDDIAREAASQLQKKLDGDDPIWCRVYHSQLGEDERTNVLDVFRQAGPSALLACRSLDEGVDIPDVDAALLAASTQSLRQRIQRIGRTLRKGSGKKRSLIVTFYAQGTNDENVTAEDRALFDGVATIHDEDDASCLRRVRELL